MKCENCGEEILSGNKCLNCGFKTENFQVTNNEVQNYNNAYNQNDYNKNNIQNFQTDDKKSNMVAFISFLLPEAGLVLYFLNRRTKPIFAKSFKTGFLIRIILNIIGAVILSIFYAFVVMMVMIGLGVAAYY